MKNSIPLSIWLADDDEDDRLLFTDALKEISDSSQALTFKDCVELVEKINQENLPDVLFLDINMPKKSGFVCLEELKNNPELEKIPVVIYSTSSNKDDILRAYSLGAHFYITKPTSFRTLKEVLVHILNIDWQFGRPSLYDFRIH